MAEQILDTLILSDLHLGSEVSRAREATALLTDTAFRRLVLLGDIFSDLNFRRLTSEHWKFLSRIRKLSNPKRKVEVVWVEGNHDQGLSQIMSHLVGVPVYQRYVWEFQGKRHLAVHGHQFDPFCRKNEFVSRVGERLFYTLQKLDGNSKRFSRLIDRVNTRWLRLESRVAEGAFLYARAGRVERIFCGHTHVATHQRRHGIDYYNSGSWIGFASTRERSTSTRPRRRAMPSNCGWARCSTRRACWSLPLEASRACAAKKLVQKVDFYSGAFSQRSRVSRRIPWSAMIWR
jgi:UDP-2,3-diacylglucosamine pyrophosphatase LpxH